MADTAAHLVDRVFPVVKVRQWVFSFPFALRYRLAYDARLTTDVLNVFIRALVGDLRRRAKRLLGLCSTESGAVTFIQRFGDAPLPLDGDRRRVRRRTGWPPRDSPVAGSRRR
jgi:hypothetical protein